MVNDFVYKMFNYIIFLNGYLILLINSKIFENRYLINIDEIKVVKLIKCYI